MPLPNVPPPGYDKLPPNIECKCHALYKDVDGNYWCCGAKPIETMSTSGTLGNPIDVSIAKQLGESIQRNSRMKARLQQVLNQYFNLNVELKRDLLRIIEDKDLD